ncbi:MAG TPA: DUF87 domain-containing protein [Thermodesulfobacteriota bacterium]|nr:DUF87 domain-containing protein [Thermodesulfobacteriota bacterium]
MLFSNSQVMGTFKGFNERGLEFAAEIIAPYDASMLERPQLGQFLLIELGSVEEAALGRITRFVPSGLLATAEGEDYVNTMQRRQQAVPEDLKQQRLKYRVQVKLLGAVRVVRENGREKIIYIPSQRRLPHLGAKVALPSSQVLAELCKLSKGETDLGNFVLGEFVYSGAGSPSVNQVLRPTDPPMSVKFDIRNLVSRRSVVFARAGYGKSNLIKYLISELYKNGQPRTETGQNVGTLIFDADGEYFWPDRIKSRPGLCDVPHLGNHIVVFTNRQPGIPYYGSWKAGEVRIDIRDLPPRDVIGISVSSDRQEQQNVLKLKSLTDTNWRQLVDLIQAHHLLASDNDMGRLMGYPPNQIANSAAEIAAARSNMNNIVRLLHDPNSQLLSGTLQALTEGHIVVIDISLLSSTAGNTIAGLILRRIFSHNQENFTGGQAPIPVVTVIEEAQSVLGRSLEESSPFVEWVKEGRKYDLGAILVTQQPGAMAPELLSQADNWFCFHLLSEGDAGVLGKYNSHYSDDILAHLIGEPIPGNCFMWSAPLQPFVLPVRVRSFEELYHANVKHDPATEPVKETPAQRIHKDVSNRLDDLAQKLRESLKTPGVKFCEIPKVGTGIYKGQLYHLIKEIKSLNDYESENQLMEPLLSKILGGVTPKLSSHNNREYYVAGKEDWERALGTSIHTTPIQA